MEKNGGADKDGNHTPRAPQQQTWGQLLGSADVALSRVKSPRPGRGAGGGGAAAGEEGDYESNMAGEGLLGDELGTCVVILNIDMMNSTKDKANGLHLLGVLQRFALEGVHCSVSSAGREGQAAVVAAAAAEAKEVSEQRKKKRKKVAKTAGAGARAGTKRERGVYADTDRATTDDPVSDLEPLSPLDLAVIEALEDMASSRGAFQAPVGKAQHRVQLIAVREQMRDAAPGVLPSPFDHLRVNVGSATMSDLARLHAHSPDGYIDLCKEHCPACPPNLMRVTLLDANCDCDVYALPHKTYLLGIVHTSNQFARGCPAFCAIMEAHRSSSPLVRARCLCCHPDA